LYDNSEPNLFESCLLTTSFCQRFNLSAKGCKDLVKILLLLLPKNSKLPKTYSQVLSLTEIDKLEIDETKYCGNCKLELTTNNCDCESFEGNQFDQFYSVSIKPQLQILMNNYYSFIIEYEKSEKNFIDLIESNYYVENHNQNSISLMIYTDGISVFKNPGKSIWPVFMKVCELPPQLRQSKLNTVICGVYFGNNKPSSAILFKQIVHEFKSLKNTGLDFSLLNEKCHIDVEPLAICVDLPA
jgi:hypothetical protein